MYLIESPMTAAANAPAINRKGIFCSVSDKMFVCPWADGDGLRALGDIYSPIRVAFNKHNGNGHHDCHYSYRRELCQRGFCIPFAFPLPSCFVPTLPVPWLRLNKHAYHRDKSYSPSANPKSYITSKCPPQAGFSCPGTLFLSEHIIEVIPLLLPCLKLYSQPNPFPPFWPHRHRRITPAHYSRIYTLVMPTRENSPRPWCRAVGHAYDKTPYLNPLSTPMIVISRGLVLATISPTPQGKLSALYPDRAGSQFVRYCLTIAYKTRSRELFGLFDSV